jgi:hypothetical protein
MYDSKLQSSTGQDEALHLTTVILHTDELRLSHKLPTATAVHQGTCYDRHMRVSTLEQNRRVSGCYNTSWIDLNIITYAAFKTLHTSSYAQ